MLREVNTGVAIPIWIEREQLGFQQKDMNGGVVVRHSPPFQRRGARGIKPLEAEGGVVSNRSRSLLIDARVALLILFEIANHPVCAAEERNLLIEAQPPLLENGGECAWSNHFSLSQSRVGQPLLGEERRP